MIEAREEDEEEEEGERRQTKKKKTTAGVISHVQVSFACFHRLPTTYKRLLDQPPPPPPPPPYSTLLELQGLSQGGRKRRLVSRGRSHKTAFFLRFGGEIAPKHTD